MNKRCEKYELESSAIKIISLRKLKQSKDVIFNMSVWGGNVLMEKGVWGLTC